MKATILTKNSGHLDELRRLLGEEGFECAVTSGGLNQFISTSPGLAPDMLIVEMDEKSPELHGIERIVGRNPQLAVVLMVEDPSKDFLLEAIHLGVREVLALPFRPEVAREVIRRLCQRAVRAVPQSGKVLVFQPSKGGSGATFLASNLAYALARLGQRVSLIDLNLHFGDAALHVSDLTSPANVADVAQQIQRLDGDFLMSSMIRVLPNFGILASPESPEQAVGIRPENVERMISVARERYDYVIIDIYRSLDPVSLRALDCADVIHLVLQLTLPYIRDASRLLAVFDSLGYPRSKIGVIVNRYEKGGEITLRDVESTLGVKVVRTIPNSFNAVASSINQGKPIVDFQPGDRVAKTLLAMASQMGQGEIRDGWLQRLFRKSPLKT